MQQFLIPEEHRQFVLNYQTWGFNSEIELLNRALFLLKKSLLKQQSLLQSAELYATLYAEDDELQELTNNALNDFIE
jgi:hypothetical protein